MLYYPQENQADAVRPNQPDAFDDATLERTSKVMFSAVIKVRETAFKTWTESVDVISASYSGAGFYAERECFVGQLVSLLMPLPSELRRYDTDKTFYKMWGLVQHCSPLKGNAGFQVGVAFIGRNAPSSYTEKPMTSYRVSGVGADGFWTITESETPFRTRKHTRFWSTIGVVITADNSLGLQCATEQTATENISESGASIFSNLVLDVGDRIKITSTEHKFSATAMVRNRQSGRDRRPRLHVEFIDAVFPISEISGGASD